MRLGPGAISYRLGVLRMCKVSTSGYTLLTLHHLITLCILRRLQHALASVSLSGLACAHLRTSMCICIIVDICEPV